jgi:hypothetical protein
VDRLAVMLAYFREYDSALAMLTGIVGIILAAIVAVFLVAKS